jgi:glycosyltransferase involved in cell wall biosynthesis
MICYFVFQETPDTSVYKTQIIDVANYFQAGLKADTHFFTLIPFRGYFRNRRTLKKFLSIGSTVWPQLPFPRMYGWKMNLVLVWLFVIIRQPKTIICRGPFACWMAVRLKQLFNSVRCVFDSRGLVTEEAKEYGVYPTHIQKVIQQLERFCVKKSDHLMVITAGMSAYYMKHFGYGGSNVSVIPCTLGSDYERITFSDDDICSVRKNLNYEPDDVVLVYSGSNAKWQSFDLMLSWAERILMRNNNTKLLLLTAENELVRDFIERWPGRVICKWVKSQDVIRHLLAADYALLVREPSVTNSVSSPTKFAEYLAAGLKVIASDTMAITAFVNENKAGFVIKSSESIPSLVLERQTLFERERLHHLAKNTFSKESPTQTTSYKMVLGF